jgi:hypothetical protein
MILLAVTALSRASPLPQGFVLENGFVIDTNPVGAGLPAMGTDQAASMPDQFVV